MEVDVGRASGARTNACGQALDVGLSASHSIQESDRSEPFRRGNRALFIEVELTASRRAEADRSTVLR